MTIPFTQAALGADLSVPTLDGEETLRIPRGTQFGAMFRVPGKGLPNLRTARRGDVVVVTKIEIPKKLSVKQEKLLRDYAQSEEQSVLPESEGFLKKVKDLLGG
jgi:molecular chaperone DnaJ